MWRVAWMGAIVHPRHLRPCPKPVGGRCTRAGRVVGGCRELSRYLDPALPTLRDFAALSKTVRQGPANPFVNNTGTLSTSF